MYLFLSSPKYFVWGLYTMVSFLAAELASLSKTARFWQHNSFRFYSAQ